MTDTRRSPKPLLAAALTALLAAPAAHAQELTTVANFGGPPPGFIAPGTTRHSPGATPDGGLVALGGILYGATSGGGIGDNGGGTVFSFDPATGTLTYRHEFDGKDGSRPVARLTALGGVLYGTTIGGSPNRSSILFSFNPSTDKVADLYDFIPGNAVNAVSSGTPLIAVGNVLYGTGGGGAHNAGMVFSFDPATGTFTDRHDFSGKDGFNPSDLAVLDGVLYGTTSGGGAYYPDNASRGGTVFSLKPDGKDFRVLYSFGGVAQDGTNPTALTGLDGTLYGLVSGFSRDHSGGLFAINPATGKLTYRHEFHGRDGIEFHSCLLAVHGTLYGTAARGGAHGLGFGGYGTVFAFNPSTGAFSNIADFDGHDGAAPFAALTESGGRLYGTTSTGGSYHAGTIYAVRLGPQLSEPLKQRLPLRRHAPHASTR